MSHNFGYTPPDIRDVRAQAPQKKMLPDQMVPPGAVQTGDGWCFLKNEDGTVRVFVINATIAQTVASTSLTRAEWEAVIDKTYSWPVSTLTQNTEAEAAPEVETKSDTLQAKLDAANAEIARLTEMTRPEAMAPVGAVNSEV
jgi:hypothetical protein